MDECDEPGVEVARFNPDGSKRVAFGRAGVDLAVGGFAMAASKEGGCIPKRTSPMRADIIADEVRRVDGECEANSCLGAPPFALAHRCRKAAEDFRVKLVEGRFYGANSTGLFAATGNERQGERACARARIQQPHGSRKWPQHRRHEVGDRFRSEELPEVILATSAMFDGLRFHLVQATRTRSVPPPGKFAVRG